MKLNNYDFNDVIKIKIISGKVWELMIFTIQSKFNKSPRSFFKPLPIGIVYKKITELTEFAENLKFRDPKNTFIMKIIMGIRRMIVNTHFQPFDNNTFQQSFFSTTII